jgi:hypothetical protein
VAGGARPMDRALASIYNECIRQRRENAGREYGTCVKEIERMTKIVMQHGVTGLLCVAALLASCAFLGGCESKAPAGPGKDGAKVVTPPATDQSVISAQLPAYPLDTCVVTGGKLGGMGEAVNYVYKGRLVRFCCAGCIKTFEQDSAKFLAKIDEAAKAKAAPSK